MNATSETGDVYTVTLRKRTDADFQAILSSIRDAIRAAYVLTGQYPHSVILGVQTVCAARVAVEQMGCSARYDASDSNLESVLGSRVVVDPCAAWRIQPCVTTFATVSMAEKLAAIGTTEEHA
jgi:hypothetical protein